MTPEPTSPAPLHPFCYVRSETSTPTSGGKHVVFKGTIELKSFTPRFNSSSAWRKELREARTYCKSVALTQNCRDSCDR